MGKEALAEVSKTKLQGRDAIYIRTQGANRKGIMTVILKIFRELHKDYKGIKYEERVPCPCKGCINKKNRQHYFDFAHLKLRLERGRHKVECEKSLEELNVLELLENTFIFEQFKEGRTLALKNEISRGSSSGIRVVKIFLASSFELKKERDKIEQALGRKNKTLRKEGFIIDLLIWEDGKHIGKSLRSQDNYNLEVEACDLFTMLFYSKVGKYTREEYDLAETTFKDKGKSRILIFQKDMDLPKGQNKKDADSRFEFLEHLEDLEHFPRLFDNEDKLVNELEDAIDKLLVDEGFVDGLDLE